MTVTIEWRGLQVEGDVSDGWEGDSDLPNGTSKVFSVDSFAVKTPTGEDIAWDLKQEALDRMEELLVEESRK